VDTSDKFVPTVTNSENSVKIHTKYNTV